MNCKRPGRFAVEGADGTTTFACERHAANAASFRRAVRVAPESSGPTCDWRLWSVAEILESAMEAKGWTQKTLARVAGIPRQSISELARGKKRLMPRAAAKLGAALGLEPLGLLNAQADIELYMYENDNPDEAETIHARMPQAAGEKA